MNVGAKTLSRTGCDFTDTTPNVTSEKLYAEREGKMGVGGGDKQQLLSSSFASGKRKLRMR